MPLVKATCTNCGGSLEVDNSSEAAVCPYCGQAYIVEKAIQQFQITNQNHIENAYFVDDEYGRLKEAAEFLLSNKDYKNAYIKYAKIQADYPQKDVKDTVNLLKARTHNWSFDYYIDSIILDGTKVLDLENYEPVDSETRNFKALLQQIPEEERPAELNDFYAKLVEVHDQLADKGIKKAKAIHLMHVTKLIAVAAVFVIGLVIELVSLGNSYPGLLLMLASLIIFGRILTTNRCRFLKFFLTALILAVAGFCFFFFQTETAATTGAFSFLGGIVVAAYAVVDFLKGNR